MWRMLKIQSRCLHLLVYAHAFIRRRNREAQRGRTALGATSTLPAQQGNRLLCTGATLKEDIYALQYEVAHGHRVTAETELIGRVQQT